MHRTSLWCSTTTPGWRAVALRRADRDAGHAEAGRQRGHVLPVAHHRAVFTDAVLLSDRRNHHVNRFSAITEARTGFPGLRAGCRRRAPRFRECSRTTATAPSGSARITTFPRRMFQRRQQNLEWPHRWASYRSHGFLGGETNKWFPDLVEDNRFIEHSVARRGLSPVEGSGRQSRSGCCATSSRPTRPPRLVVLPGANHAPHHAR